MFGITGVWGAFPVAEVLTAAAAAGIFLQQDTGRA